MQGIEDVRRAAALMREAHGLLGRGPLDYYLIELAAAYDLLMTAYAPFKVGERVALTHTPEISEKVAWGWLGAKHFLKIGAQGTVKTSGCGTGGFTFGIEFDDDTWMDRNGDKHPADTKGVYNFSARSLRSVPPEWDTRTAAKIEVQDK